ncbi:MAG TPA: hypothetical protein VMF29_07060 [Candidatus Edwardsbacteria bacterium]|nr:hypothetical protein [Candidatus Edwardsbacteria bacterium]
MNRSTKLGAAIIAMAVITATGCSKSSTSPTEPATSSRSAQYTTTQTVSDEAQRNTIAFDGLAFLTGSLGGQSFLPPGKVADFDGFQYLRDNDPTDLGHNTSFVTIVAFNVLHILNADQINLMVHSAQTEVTLINHYAYQRFPLIKAFRRQLEGDIPAGCTALDRAAVMACSADLYAIDGQISYNRTKLMGQIINSMSSVQRGEFARLAALNGVGNWDQTLADPLQSLRLDPDVAVAVMTDASEMYSWYTGSVEADVYFCPERQGTYFGSFYLKDWPAMGNPNYSINEQLTARAGSTFLAALTDSQRALVTVLVDLQRSDLTSIVSKRREIAAQLRLFLAGGAADSATVIALSREYGQLDGEISYYYATHFAQVSQSLDSAQRARLTSLADSLGYTPAAGAFLYSQPIAMPAIANTDFLFGSSR